MRSRRGILTAITITALAIGAVLIGRTLWQRDRAASSGNIVLVERGNIQATVDVLGRIEPIRQLALSTRVSGTVRRIHSKEGATVYQGDLILELDGEEQRAQLEQAARRHAIVSLQLDQALQAPDAASIRLARARLRHATAVQRNAQDDYDEIADQPDAESSDEAVELEIAKVEYEIAQAEFDQVMNGASDLEVERLRIELEGAQAARDVAQRQAEHALIRAPWTGTIVRIEPHEGENVYGYSPLIHLADRSHMRIRAEINELDIAEVREGQEVGIRLDAYPGENLTGTVTLLLPGVDPARGTTTYEALIDYDGSNLPVVYAGMGVNLTIVTKEIEDTLVLPRRAIQRAGRHDIVRVVEDRRKTETVVVLGISNASLVEVLSGVREGQRIVVD